MAIKLVRGGGEPRWGCGTALQSLLRGPLAELSPMRACPTPLRAQESIKTKHPQLLYESKLYKILQGGGERVHRAGRRRTWHCAAIARAARRPWQQGEGS